MMKAQIDKVERVLLTQKEQDCPSGFDLEGVFKDFQRVEKSDKLKQRANKQVVDRLKEKREGKLT